MTPVIEIISGWAKTEKVKSAPWRWLFPLIVVLAIGVGLLVQYLNKRKIAGAKHEKNQQEELARQAQAKAAESRNAAEIESLLAHRRKLDERLSEIDSLLRSREREYEQTELAIRSIKNWRDLNSNIDAASRTSRR